MSNEKALELAVLFHVIYERKSAEFNYITRTETRIFDPESPNGKLMIATCEEILQDYIPVGDFDEAVELAEETVGYASDYFNNKWHLNERLAELKKRKKDE